MTLITLTENLSKIAPFVIQKHWLEYQLIWAVILLFFQTSTLQLLNVSGVKTTE